MELTVVDDMGNPLGPLEDFTDDAPQVLAWRDWALEIFKTTHPMMDDTQLREAIEKEVPRV